MAQAVPFRALCMAGFRNARFAAERAADAVIAPAIAGKADDVVLQWNLFAHRAVKQRHGLAIGRQQRGDTVENAAVVAEKLAAMANSVKLSRLPSGAYPRLNP